MKEKIERQFWKGVWSAMKFYTFEDKGIQKKDVIQQIRFFYLECLERGDGKKLVTPKGEDVEKPFPYGMKTANGIAHKFIDNPDLKAIQYDETGEEGLFEEEQKAEQSGEELDFVGETDSGEGVDSWEGEDFSKDRLSKESEEDGLSEIPSAFESIARLQDKIIAGAKDFDIDNPKIKFWVDYLGYKLPDYEAGKYQPGNRLEDSKQDAEGLLRHHKSLMNGYKGRDSISAFEWLRRNKILEEIQSGKNKGKKRLNESARAINLLSMFFYKVFGPIDGDEIFSLFMQTFGGLNIKVPSKEKQKRAFQRAWIQHAINTDWEIFHKDFDAKQSGDITIYEPKEDITEVTEEILQEMKSSTVKGKKAEDRSLMEKLQDLKRQKHTSYNTMSQTLHVSENAVKHMLKEERDYLKEKGQDKKDSLLEDKFQTMFLTVMVEAMKDVKWSERGFLKRFKERKSKEEKKKQAEIDTVNQLKEMLRKDGMSEEEIEAGFKGQDEIFKKELRARLVQIEQDWNKKESSASD